MDLEKLKPWNWFKHEEGDNGREVPAKKSALESTAFARPDSLLELHREMDRWFDDAFKSFGMPSRAARLPGLAASSAQMEPFFKPQIDVAGDERGYQVSLDVPGLTEDDLSLEITDDLLVIKGQKEARSEDKDKHYYRVERSYGTFRRTLSLPDDADAGAISAKLDKGVLRLDIPRREGTRNDVRRISINS